MSKPKGAKAPKTKPAQADKPGSAASQRLQATIPRAMYQRMIGYLPKLIAERGVPVNESQLVEHLLEKGLDSVAPGAAR